MERAEEPIRILHVLAGMDRAGTETMIMNLYRKLDRGRMQFDFVVCTERKCDYDDEIAALGGRIHRCPRYVGANHFAYKKWWKDFFPAHPEYKIVHGHIGSTAAIYLNIAKKYGRFTIAHSHNTSVDKTLKGRLYALYSYRTRYVADYFFGCSRQALIDRYGEKVEGNSSIARVLPNAIDVSQYRYDEGARAAVRDELGIPKEAFVAGTVGRLTAQKNPFEMLEIINEMRQRKPDVLFLWAGRGELQDKIEKKAAELGLTQNIRFLGARDDVNRVLQAMDVFLFPSLWEGLSVAAVEAQAAGLPIICNETLTDETRITKNCVFLPLGNPALWADTALAVNPAVRQDTTEQIIAAGYDISSTARWLQEFYTERFK